MTLTVMVKIENYCIQTITVYIYFRERLYYVGFTSDLDLEMTLTLMVESVKHYIVFHYL